MMRRVMVVGVMMAGLGCASTSEDVMHERSAAVWESIEGYSTWEQVPRGEADELTLFVSPESDDGTALFVLEDPRAAQVHVLEEDAPHWFAVRFTLEGEVLAIDPEHDVSLAPRAANDNDDGNKEGVRQCVTCHLNQDQLEDWEP